MNTISDQLNKIISEVVEIKQKIISTALNTDVDEFFLANKLKLKSINSESLVVVISEEKKDWTKNEMEFKGKKFHFSFFPKNTPVKTETIHKMLLNKDKMFCL